MVVCVELAASHQVPSPTDTRTQPQFGLLRRCALVRITSYRRHFQPIRRNIGWCQSLRALIDIQRDSTLDTYTHAQFL